MELKKLDRKYQGYEINVYYETDYYYDVITNKKENEITFELIKKKFDKTIIKSYSFKLFSRKDNICYGCVNDDKIICLLEYYLDKEYNILKIENIYVDNDYRNHKLGHLLMNFAINKAKENKVRAIKLETESCNIKAIDFYTSFNFDISGFDKYKYTNEDVKDKEIDLEMILELN